MFINPLMKSQISPFEYLAICVSLFMLTILLVAVPILLLDYNICTTPQEEQDTRTSIFFVTIGVSLATVLVLYAANRDLRSRKIAFSAIIVFLGLVLDVIYYVFFFSSAVCYG